MTLGQPVRVAAGSAALVLGAAFTFGPFLAEESRDFAGMGCLLLGALLGSERTGDRAESQPLRVIWEERDPGQKFTLIMFHIVLLSVIAAFAWNLTTKIDAWYGAALGAFVLTAALALTWRNWKKRNAR